MVRRAACLMAALAMSACQSNPKQTVLNLDTTDRKWSSKACVQARKAVFEYDDGERLRGAAGLANVVTPYVGSAAALLLSWRKDPTRARLNEQVRRACVSPPKRMATPTRTAGRPAPAPARGGRS
jgi:hypothetical protein